MKPIFIVGPNGSGKSLFARLLKAEIERLALGIGPETLGTADVPKVESLTPKAIRIIETGEILIGELAKIMEAGPVVMQSPGFRWVEFLRQRKELYRHQLRAVGDLLAGVHGGWMLEKALEDFDSIGPDCVIVVGLRRQAEVCGYFGNTERMSLYEQDGHFIFIERPGVGLGTGSFDREFFEKLCPVHVVNTGREEDLQASAEWVATSITN